MQNLMVLAKPIAENLDLDAFAKFVKKNPIPATIMVCYVSKNIKEMYDRYCAMKENIAHDAFEHGQPIHIDHEVEV